MKTVIVYESKHGATAKCAQNLSQSLQGETVLCNLKEMAAPNLAQYDTVVVGGPVYMGQLSKKIKKWLIENQPELSGKKLGVFLCGMTKADKTAEVIQNLIPTAVAEQAEALEFFGGAFYMNRMNFFEKWILKKVSQSDETVVFEHGPEGDFIESFNETAIKRFVEKMNHEQV